MSTTDANTTEDTFQTAKERLENRNGGYAGARAPLTAAELSDEESEEESNVGQLAASCSCCGWILPSDTNRDEIVECTTCGHMTEVDR